MAATASRRTSSPWHLFRTAGGGSSRRASHLDFDATAPVAGLKVGYVAQWMQESPATDVDRAAMETIKKLKMELKEVTLPDWPYRGQYLGIES